MSWPRQETLLMAGEIDSFKEGCQTKTLVLRRKETFALMPHGDIGTRGMGPTPNKIVRQLRPVISSTVRCCSDARKESGKRDFLCHKSFKISYKKIFRSGFLIFFLKRWSNLYIFICLPEMRLINPLEPFIWRPPSQALATCNHHSRDSWTQTHLIALI